MAPLPRPMSTDGNSNQTDLQIHSLSLGNVGEAPSAGSASPTRVHSLARAGTALGLGALAAFCGSILYSGVGAITGREFGVVALIVGAAVGKAVRRGARGQGGWPYQVLAIALTYIAIVSTYVPSIAKKIQDVPGRIEHAAVLRAHNEPALPASRDSGFSVVQTGAPVAAPVSLTRTQDQLGFGTVLLGFAELLLYAAVEPVAAGRSNLMGLLIIGVGVLVAGWINRRQKLPTVEAIELQDSREDAAAA